MGEGGAGTATAGMEGCMHSEVVGVNMDWLDNVQCGQIQQVWI